MQSRISTRRAFLMSTCGVALALSGCGDNSGTQTNSASAGGASNEIVFNHGNGAEPMSLDPHFDESHWEDNIVGDMIMGLTTESAKGEPIPGAALSWDTSADGLTWTFHLRDHLWSDGKPVTAGDFVFAWQRILDPKTAASYAYYLYPVKNAQSVNTGKMPLSAVGISAPDDKTVVIQLEHPVPYLPQFLTHASTFPVPRHVVEEKGNAWARAGSYVGNGAFTLVEWVPNDHVTLAKNPKFYDAENVKIDRVVFYPTMDYEAALKRFRAGELDLQDRLPSGQIDWLKANMPETLRVGPVLTTEYLVANQTRKPFEDVRVREALNLGLDREAITEKIRKLGETPAYGYVPPGVANYPGGVTLDFKDLPQAEKVKRAQQLMTQAGFGPQKRLKTTLQIRSSAPDSLRIYAAIQAMWKTIYIDAEIVQNDTAVFYKRMQQGDFDIGAAAWGADYNDATTFLDLLRKGNANNYGRYANPKYDALLDKATMEADLKKRGDLLAQAEAIAVKDQAWISELFWVSGALVRPYVKGWEENPADRHRTRWMSLDTAARTAALR